MARLNGTVTELPSATSLEALAQFMKLPLRGVAIAVNEHVIRRTDWSTTFIGDGDRIEIVTAFEGG